MAHESEQVLRDRIEASRSRMAETVEEIGTRVNPDRVQRQIKARARGEVDQFKANAKEKVRSTMKDMEHEVEYRGRSVWRTVKDNPVPATLMGVGLAWMVANSVRDDDSYRPPRVSAYGPAEPYPVHYPPTRATGYPPQPGASLEGGLHAGGYDYASDFDEDDEGIRDRAEEVGDEVRERSSEMAHRARNKAEDAMDTVSDQASELAEKGRHQAREARHRVSEWGDRVEHRAMRAERRVEHAVQDNPLAAGAMAAALGFAAGLMVPETQREHELMGQTRDRVLDRAQSSAREATEKARESAKDTAGEAARRAVDEAFPGGDSDDDRAMTEPGRG